MHKFSVLDHILYLGEEYRRNQNFGRTSSTCKAFTCALLLLPGKHELS